MLFTYLLPTEFRRATGVRADVVVRVLPLLQGIACKAAQRLIEVQSGLLQR